MTINPILLWFLFCGCTIFGYIVGQLMARKACADRADAWNEALGAYVLRQHQASQERVIHDVPTLETPVRWLDEEKE